MNDGNWEPNHCHNCGKAQKGPSTRSLRQFRNLKIIAGIFSQVLGVVHCFHLQQNIFPFRLVLCSEIQMLYVTLFFLFNPTFSNFTWWSPSLSLLFKFGDSYRGTIQSTSTSHFVAHVHWTLKDTHNHDVSKYLAVLHDSGPNISDGFLYTPEKEKFLANHGWKYMCNSCYDEHGVKLNAMTPLFLLSTFRYYICDRDYRARA